MLQVTTVSRYRYLHSVSHLDPALLELAQTFGIATEFWDWQGQHTLVQPGTITAVLDAFGVDAATSASAQQAVQERQLQAWRRMLPTCVVARHGTSVTFDVHVTHGEQVVVWIDLEGGGVRSGLHQVDNWNAPREVDGRPTGEATFEVPEDLPLGYHTLKALSAGAQASALLIVTPRFLGLPARTNGRRAWGVATQLYSVRSQQSWGTGDLADLTDLAVWAGAEHGAGFVLVNPMHAAEPTVPMEPSPYLPTSRRFANPIYLRPERIVEYAELDTVSQQQFSTIRGQLHEALDGLDRLDRNTAWVAKREALHLIYRVPRSVGRDLAYRAYQRREGGGLEGYATWCAIAEEHGNDWHVWPDDLRHPESPAVQSFRDSHQQQVDFHRWLQWAMDEQLGAAQFAAVRAGCTLGILHDLAVGVHPSGADSWGLQDVFARRVTVGAPPDAYNQNGQDWTQPPWRPDRLAELAYAPFRELLVTAFRSAGGLRVDHIIGLFRLWWIPEGNLPTEGTYVRYDHDALIGILALEAHRAGALVVGEDLGTVEPWVRDYLRDRGIFGTSILWFEFEFDAGGAPLRPEWWREYCLASVTTHDLPPTSGYLAGDHVRLRHSLGLLTRSLDEELAAAESERSAWVEELRARGALRADIAQSAQDSLDPTASNPVDAEVEETVLALHRYLTWTPAKLLAVALGDMVGDRRTQNQPGTVDEYPNWRVPLAGPDGSGMLLEEVMANRRAARLAEMLRQEFAGE